jgi:transglutaminase-like putative cysteine protease
VRYRAIHTTKYAYDASVSLCQSEVRLVPRTLPWQRTLESHIETTPPSASTESHEDYFGNAVTTFTILERHDRFSTVATSVIEVDDRDATKDVAVTWEAARDEVAAHSVFETLEAFEFTFDSPLVAVAPELSSYAVPSFPPERPLIDAIEDLSHRIHTEFKYTPRATRVDTPVLEVLRLKKGVCQDYAHVMIGAVRSMGLAARYVSGYLRSGANVQGAEASHAWVSVFVPGVGWFDIDPTNDMRPGTGHITLAWGRDYADVAPVKGVALGGGHQVVEVTVRVDPIDQPLKKSEGTTASTDSNTK